MAALFDEMLICSRAVPAQHDVRGPGCGDLAMVRSLSAIQSCRLARRDRHSGGFPCLERAGFGLRPGPQSAPPTALQEGKPMTSRRRFIALVDDYRPVLCLGDNRLAGDIAEVDRARRDGGQGPRPREQFPATGAVVAVGDE